MFAVGSVVALQLAPYQMPILFHDSSELHVHDRAGLMFVPAVLVLEGIESAISVLAVVEKLDDGDRVLDRLDDRGEQVERIGSPRAGHSRPSHKSLRPSCGIGSE